MAHRALEGPWRFMVTEIMKILPHFSRENLIRMASIAEKLTADEDLKREARGLRKFFEQGHPSIEIGRQIILSLSPRCRDKLIRNFFLNASLIGAYRREETGKELGYKTPYFLVISPTMRCNLRCPGCYAGEYEQETELSFELFDRVLNEAEDMGIFFATISGGEPFIRQDLLEIFEKHDETYFQVYTNGTLIDEKLAKRLSRLGNVAPMISIEGFEEETDERRGKGTFKRIISAVDYLKEEGVVFGGSITVTRRNNDLVCSEELIDFLVERGARVIWYFQYIPIGRCPQIELMPTPEQRDKLRRRINDLRSRKPVFIGDFWNDGPHVDGCIAGGKRYFHINSKGDVEPCVFTHFAVDNIKNKSLKEALNSDFFKMIRGRQPYRKNLLTPCMIIDAPEVLREAVSKSGAYPTHPGAETIITSIAPEIDKYSKAYQQIADSVWTQEWASKFKDRDEADLSLKR